MFKKDKENLNWLVSGDESECSINYTQQFLTKIAAGKPL